MCADSRKQRNDISREDAAAPTVTTESAYITAIDAEEEHDVAIIEFPGALLHAYMDHLVVMVLHGELAELIVAVAPKIYSYKVLP